MTVVIEILANKRERWRLWLRVAGSGTEVNEQIGRDVVAAHDNRGR